MSFTIPGLGPIANPQVWDVVYLGGQGGVGATPSPGIVTVAGFKRSNEWDVKKGKGAQGATISYTGRTPAKGTLTFKLWTDQQIETDWPTFSNLFQYDPTKATINAVDIYHPSLASLGITSIVCEDIGAVEHKGNQLYEVEVALLEYYPPPPVPAVSTPSTSQTNQDTPEAPAPTAEQLLSAAEAQQAAIP